MQTPEPGIVLNQEPSIVESYLIKIPFKIQEIALNINIGSLAFCIHVCIVCSQLQSAATR